MSAKKEVPEVAASNLVRDSERLLQSAQYEESLAAAQSALRLRPNNADAYDALSVDYAALHRWEDAMSAARSALHLKPDDQKAKQHLAWAMLSSQTAKQTAAHAAMH